MIHIKDHKQQHLFDPWGFLSPKRRQILEQGSPGIFREHPLEELPVEQMASFFTSGSGRPTKELHTVLGVVLLQQALDLSDKAAIDQLCFNIQSNVRLKRSGAWWYPSNANNILKLRCAKYNKTFDRIMEKRKLRIKQCVAGEQRVHLHIVPDNS